ncbi:MAG: ribonuclease HI [Chloroflexi bacterium]|nr:ribonuclease HI [Chloroflexota bacterium]
MPAPGSDAVQIYTDGGCDPNPGPGGWGAVLIYGLKTLELSGGEAASTNNRMELTAAIEALRSLKRACVVTLCTDSRYLQKGISKWLEGWKRQGWKKANGQPVENQDLWQALDEQAARHQVEWLWVRGHHGNPLNERADQLATQARRNRQLSPKAVVSKRPTQAMADRVIPRVAIYCRACTLGVPGPAGYAATIVRDGAPPKTVSGGWKLATSNVMELWAAVAGLRALKERSQVTLFTTSKYVFDNVTRQLQNWERNHWRTKAGQEVKNLEIWQELVAVQGDHDITWRHLSADSRGEYAEAAAKIARREAKAQARQP